MVIDLSHNKIISATMTEGFRKSVDSVLIPMLSETYGARLRGIQMYEDYISDGFSYNKEWYYPLTVITEDGREVKWIKWEMKKGSFEGSNPYAYVGSDTVAFSYAYEVPEEFVNASAGRAHYCGKGAMNVRVETTASDITFLSGKYSQTFIDEMARQLTPAIAKAMGVVDIEESSIELAIVFAPETYMEHTSENVTYRRLLLVDKSSAPKDLWIKWTRTDGRGAYSVSDHVDSDSIVFEIGEDVPQKIKEKEYRFLSSVGKEKYHAAMGRKNIIAWREVIKRALRKGELKKAEVPVVAPAAAPVIEEQIAEVNAETAPKAEQTEQTEEDELQLAMEMARRAMDSISEDDEIIDDEADEEAEEEDELEAFYKETDDEPTGSYGRDDDDEQKELDEITRMAMEALKMAKAEADREATLVKFDEPEEEEVTEEETEPTEEEVDVTETAPIDPIAEEFEEIEDEEAYVDEEAVAEARALEPDDEEQSEQEIAEIPLTELKDEPTPAKESVQPTTVVIERSVRTAELEEKIRSEIEAKIRLEYETLARQKAEEEAEALRRQQEQLRMENERLQDRARREKAEWERLEEARRAEAEKLRAQIENQVRQEAKERERLAEAARAAVEEQHRLEAERLRAERIKIEEERRLDEERRRAEEAARKERERLAEAERAKRAEEVAKAEEPKYIDNNYTYVSKTVRLLFRRSVDPNITARLHEIIKATLEYYGKEKVYMRIKATVPDSSTVCLEFVKIPLEEMELLSNIIKVIGNSGLGIAKAILE